jgi:protein disulfide-isomerase
VTVPVFSSPSQDAVLEPGHNLNARGASKDSDELTAPDASPTLFGGIEVPPLKQLTPDNFDETIKDGYW